MLPHCSFLDASLFFFNAPAATEIYTLSLHDALPIYGGRRDAARRLRLRGEAAHRGEAEPPQGVDPRSEEHTSELQSHHDLVCRLLLEKKNSYQPSLPDDKGCALERSRHPRCSAASIN